MRSDLFRVNKIVYENKISIHPNMSMDGYYGHPPHQLGNGMLKLSEKWNVLFLKFVMKQSL